ncbi:hypothetical protein Nepgr_026669 [Nepenthes gracilis]|uniref:Uncharacterized protein n=1 Tax=Nepenthes gracilis TaxID=150966 RepID=A0AAD3Y2R1_NEPGR|nr:hypothetical protein Nepgr_026669 [Nepenthes gracilis]
MPWHFGVECWLPCFIPAECLLEAGAVGIARDAVPWLTGPDFPISCVRDDRFELMDLFLRALLLLVGPVCPWLYVGFEMQLSDVYDIAFPVTLLA